MNNRSKTYHFFASLTLALFLNSVLLPSSIAAGTLFCNMDEAEMLSCIQNCCDFHEGDLFGEITEDRDKDVCTYQEVCSHFLSKDETDNYVIHKISKEKIPAVSADKLPVLPDVKREFTGDRLKHAIVNSSPPIFLLNSSFLN